MSKRCLSESLFVLALLVVSPMAIALDQGTKAPPFAIPSTGRPVKLADYVGKIVYLDFWASWCGPCKQSFPWMNEMQAKYGSKGLQIIGVNLDAKQDDGLHFLATTPASFTIAFDAQGASARQYGVKGMPTSLLIARDGTIAKVHMGFNPAEQEELERAIVSALANSK
jgi:cytochrome c biogenesis protein CcmG, thiol:disulfide interchange protein DsbE